MSAKETNAIIITGPTASGKTHLGCLLAHLFNGEIISADSRQVYRHLNIGTGKDISEYNLNGKNIPFHLIDIVEPNGEYNLKQFFDDANDKIKEISKVEKLPFIIGGTPLYIDSLISEYKFPLPQPNKNLREELKNLSSLELMNLIDEAYSNKNKKIPEHIDNSRPRLIRLLEELDEEKNPSVTKSVVKCRFLILGVLWNRIEIHKRIEKRLDERLKNGMIEEVENLNKIFGVSWEKLDSFGLEYRYISQYLTGKTSFNDMRNTLLARIRQFARRQDVWFRKMEQKGHNIYWIRNGDLKEANTLIDNFLNFKPLPAPVTKISNIHYGKKTQYT